MLCFCLRPTLSSGDVAQSPTVPLLRLILQPFAGALAADVDEAFCGALEVRKSD